MLILHRGYTRKCESFGNLLYCSPILMNTFWTEITADVLFQSGHSGHNLDCCWPAFLVVSSRSENDFFLLFCTLRDLVRTQTFSIITTNTQKKWNQLATEEVLTKKVGGETLCSAFFFAVLRTHEETRRRGERKTGVKMRGSHKMENLPRRGKSPNTCGVDY